MLESDFFTFCTSLKPLELKAMGELSHVQHLEDGQTVYARGDPGDVLYIINRGVVEVVHQHARGAPATGYLSRGDIFGDLEALANLPRGQVVRTCEPVSLQVFERENFSELARRIPSFFRYLAEHLANRLVQARDFALSQSHCLQLSGNLANFDLVTIYQTIVHSLQTGELSIVSEDAETVCAFMFEAGQPRCGQFQHLIGEEAFAQLFLSNGITGTFSFSTEGRPITESIRAAQITRKGGDMLINALQARDEFEALKARICDEHAELHRTKLNFAWPETAPPELRPIAEQIWQIAYSTPIAISALYDRCFVSQLKIYQVVQELLGSEHFTLVSSAAIQQIA